MNAYAAKLNEMHRTINQEPSLSKRLRAVQAFYVGVCCPTELPGGMADEIIEALERLEGLESRAADTDL